MDVELISRCVSAATIAVAVANLVVLLRWRRIREPRAHLRGWIEGRQAMLLSLVEAIERGMTIEEWSSAEGERDAQRVADVLGADVALAFMGLDDRGDR